MPVLQLQVQREARTETKKDDRPDLIWIRCYYCGSQLHIYGRAIDDPLTYQKACLIVHSWIRQHNHCPVTRNIPGLFLRMK